MAGARRRARRAFPGRPAASLVVTLAVTFCVAAAAGTPIPAVAQTIPVVAATLVQRIDTWRFSPPSPDPAGVTHVPGPGGGRIVVADSEVDETTGAGYHGVNLWTITPTGSVVDMGTTLAFSNEPTGLSYDPAGNRLFISADDQRRIFVDRPGPDGRFGTGDDAVTSIDVRAFSTDTEDPEFDPATGHLFFLDGATTRVYEIDPVDGVFGDGDDAISSFDVGRYGATDTEALAADPARNTLLVGDRRSKVIYEVTKAGTLVSTIDASGVAGLSRISGMTLGPSTDGSSGRHLWIVDRASDNGSNPSENDGKLFEIRAPVPGNAPPSVHAGPDLTVTSPDAAVLAGTVADDGLPDPPGATSAAWSVVSGPGAVTFGDPASPATTATFAAEGTYVLRLTADDTGAQTSDDVTVAVFAEGSGPPSVVERAVGSGTDDAEENASGAIGPASSDLELVVDGASQQTVGLRFTGVQIPRGATILRAYVQFQVDEVTTGAASLTIRGQDADAPPTFSTAKFDITSRPPTDATVAWSPAPWGTRGEAGPGQRTPDLAAVVQEIVLRSGWSPGNPLVLMVSGSGTRTAEAFEGGAPPSLHVEYSSEPVPNRAPVIDSVSVTPPSPGTDDTVSAAVTAYDPDGDPITATYQWIRNGADLLGRDAATLDLSLAGNGDEGDQIAVRVTVSDGSAAAGPVTSATVTVAAAPPDPPPPAGSFTFAAAGDHGANAATAASLSALDASGSSFYLALGDLDYDETPTDEAWCDYVKARLPTLGPTFPFEVLVGNHEDDLGADGHILNHAACLPDRLGATIGPSSHYGVEYFVDYPPSDPLVRVIMIAADHVVNGVDYEYTVGSSRYAWLASTIDAARAAQIPWVVVGAHKPCLSASGGCSAGEDLMHLLVEKRVDLFLAGHHHNYQRGKQLRLDPSTCPALPASGYDPDCVADDGADGMYAKGGGTVAVIAGAFGVSPSLLDASDPEAPYFARTNGSANGFVRYTVSAERIDASFVASTGTFSDAFSIVGGPPPPPDTSPPSVPQGLVGTPVNGTTVGLSWQPSTDDVGVHHYEILRDGAALATSATPTYTDATVAPGSTHLYAVRAIDAAGNASAASAPVSVTTPAGTGTALVFAPVADTYVSQANPTANFGGATKFAVDAKPQEHALLRFAVTGVDTSPVVRATLRLYATNGSPMGGSVFPVADTSWNESTVTWNTAPPAGPTAVGSLGSVISGTWYEVDVSSIVAGDGDGVVSMRLITTSNNGADYTSREGAAGFGPELVVELGAPP